MHEELCATLPTIRLLNSMTQDSSVAHRRTSYRPQVSSELRSDWIQFEIRHIFSGGVYFVNDSRVEGKDTT